MRRNAVISRLLTAVCCVGIAGIGTTALILPSTLVAAAESGASDAALTSAVKERLKGKNFKDVTVRVQDGTVTLSGQVDLFAYKDQAIKKAKKVKDIKAVRDNIAVGGPTIPDNVLQKNLLRRIEMDRVGYGEVFDAISVAVQNGVVLLGGHAIGPVTQQSAVALAAYTPGVKEVINQIGVDPVSQFDDGIRIATYRAIYGYPPLQRYAIVPWKPIRISVQNGRVTLYGVVDSEMDKQLAYTRAMQVPNVFQVTNDLVVSNDKTEKSKKT
jgi:hyperosmotically inducible periplasmic protein